MLYGYNFEKHVLARHRNYLSLKDFMLEPKVVEHQKKINVVSMEESISKNQSHIFNQILTEEGRKKRSLDFKLIKSIKDCLKMNETNQTEYAMDETILDSKISAFKPYIENVSLLSMDINYRKFLQNSKEQKLLAGIFEKYRDQLTIEQKREIVKRHKTVTGVINATKLKIRESSCKGFIETATHQNYKKIAPRVTLIRKENTSVGEKDSKSLSIKKNWVPSQQLKNNIAAIMKANNSVIIPRKPSKELKDPLAIEDDFISDEVEENKVESPIKCQSIASNHMIALTIPVEDILDSPQPTKKSNGLKIRNISELKPDCQVSTLP